MQSTDAGEKSDADPINDRIEVLRERFGFEKVVFVSDSGTYGTENIRTIREAGFDYIASRAWRAQKKRQTELRPKQLNRSTDGPFRSIREEG